MELTASQMQTRERALTASAVVVVTLIAWVYLAMAGMPDGGGVSMAMPASGGSSLTLLAMGLVMWSIMMVAMMLPAATPMILTYARVHQQRAATGRPGVPTSLFVVGYLAVWIGFSVLAAGMQWGLHHSSLLSSAMGQVGPLIAGGLLITAGAFQFSALKQACLRKCRSPLSLIMTDWREGNTGAVMMGVRHGAYCTGCCWALMLLMFVGGVMSLVWMAGLALYFLAEKLLPWPRQMSAIAGILLIGAGIAVPLILA